MQLQVGRARLCIPRSTCPASCILAVQRSSIHRHSLMTLPGTAWSGSAVRPGLNSAFAASLMMAASSLAHPVVLDRPERQQQEQQQGQQQPNDVFAQERQPSDGLVVSTSGNPGLYDWAAATHVSDLVNSEASSPPEHAVDQLSNSDDTPWECLPQGYRTADRVAIYRVPTPSATCGPDAALHDTSNTTKSSLVVYKTSNYRDPVTQEMDSFKYAATLNEWTTFNKFSAEMQSRYLVQLLGYSKSATSMCIISEYCNGGDLQSLIDKQAGTLGTHTAAAPALPPPVTHPAAAAVVKTQRAPAAVPRPAPQAMLKVADVKLLPQPNTLPQHARAKLLSLCFMLSTQLQASRAWLAGLLGAWCAQLVQQWRDVSAAAVKWQQGWVARLGWGHVSQERWAELMTSRAPAAPGMTEAQVAHVAAHVVQGLATLHKAGLTHGDIKPANVFISSRSSRKRRTSLSVPHKLRLTKPRIATTTAASNTAGTPISVAVASNIVSLASYDAASSMDGSLASVSGSFDEGQLSGKAAVLDSSSTGSGSEGVEGGAQVQTRPDMVFKLGDFGTMRERGRKHLHYFVSGFGYSPEYASPEALRYGTAKADQRSDLWSLGIMLVQLLLGRLPGTAVAMANLQDPAHHRERAAFLVAHVPGPTVVAELKRARADVSPALLAVIEACLQVCPNQRPDNATQLLEFDWFTSGQAHHVQLAA